MSQINSKIKTLISSYLNRFATVIFCGTTCLCLICKLYISHLMYAIANTKNLHLVSKTEFQRQRQQLLRRISYIPWRVKSVKYPVSSYPLSGILYSVSCILYPVSCILYPVSCILYPVSYILWYINYLISLIDLWYFHFTMCVYYIYIHTPH